MLSMQRLEREGTFSQTSYRTTLSVIVPLAAEEPQWPHLLDDLSDQMPADGHVLLASPEEAPLDFQDTTCHLRFTTEWLTTRPGRAAQMNDAARAAKGAYLWFLHADSRLTAGSVAALIEALRRRPNDLHYFGLRFHDGPRWLRINELGVSIRCRLFGLPFGDQGFCIARDAFASLQGFDERAPYGEDHLFVWKARRHGVKLCRIGSLLLTSGRKYAERGWLRTTCRHVRLTFRQAIPEFARYFAHREQQ